jgi:hypothetical protein
MLPRISIDVIGQEIARGASSDAVSATKADERRGHHLSTMRVESWVESLPSAEQVRPGCCSRCGAASQPWGSALVPARPWRPLAAGVGRRARR